MIITGLSLGHLQGHKKYPKKPLEYTEREKKIINGEDVATLRRLDVTKLIQKAKNKMNDPDIAKQLEEMYGDFLYDPNYYSKKDMMIIEGTAENVTDEEVYTVLNKAKGKNDDATYKVVSERYDISPDLIIDIYYSPLERKIINGEDIPELKSRDVTRVMNKAIMNGDYRIAERISDMYDAVLNPVEERKYTLQEAIDVLSRLDKEYEETHKK